MFARIGVELVSKIVVQGNIFNLNRWRKKEENEPSWVSVDCTLLCNADTTLEYENEPSPDVLEEAKIYSCAEVVVRITDDNPLLNWIPRFAMRFLNKTRIGCGGKESIAQFGEEELTSSVKRIPQEVFVCHHDRTRTISCITKSGIVRGRSWTRQILSDAWESMIAETKLADQPRMLIKELLEVECRKFYVWSVNIEAHGHTWQGKATQPRKDESRERVGTTIEGEAMIDTFKDGIAERKRVRLKSSN